MNSWTNDKDEAIASGAMIKESLLYCGCGFRSVVAALPAHRGSAQRDRLDSMGMTHTTESTARVLNCTSRRFHLKVYLAITTHGTGRTPAQTSHVIHRPGGNLRHCPITCAGSASDSPTTYPPQHITEHHRALTRASRSR